MLPKTSAYVESRDGQTRWMYFLIAMKLQIFTIKKVRL